LKEGIKKMKNNLKFKTKEEKLEKEGKEEFQKRET